MMKKSKQAVVFVHGIWMNGLQLRVLERRVKRFGYSTDVFSYRSLVLTPKQNAHQLKRFLASIDADQIHLVAHSLGGLILKHLMHSYADDRIGRVIMLGTPIKGSAVAKEFSRHKLTQKLVLGRSVQRGLLGDAPPWPEDRPLAMIAGSRGFGLGALVNGPFVQGDGTVALQETRSKEVSHHHTVPISHTGLVFSNEVVEAIVSYIKHGDFTRLGK